MSSLAVLRSFAHKGSCRFLKSVPSVKLDCTKKMIYLSPRVSSIVEPSRGPFTPEEKRGKAHLMMASTHWKTERIVAVSMVGILPACLVIQGPVMDFLLSMSVLAHGFWGVDGVMYDYLDKWVGNSKIPHYLWYALTMIALAGIINFNYNDVGVTKAVQMLWAL